jgi:phage head maturation protease
MDNSFTFGGKALSAVTLDSGDMLIEGFCALFGGLDRQNEQFAPGSFARAIKAFLSGPASLCYQHQTEKLLGKVLELEEIPGIGVRLKARVDGAL